MIFLIGKLFPENFLKISLRQARKMQKKETKKKMMNRFLTLFLDSLFAFNFNRFVAIN